MPKSADAFRTISEVAEWLGVQTHVLRFWESKFTQIKPVKRAGGRRYYRPTDMLLLGGIRKLLHDDGMTIKGVQKLLREEGMAYVADMSAPLDDEIVSQIDSTVAPEADFVEAELASSVVADSVTPFEYPTKSKADEDAAKPVPAPAAPTPTAPAAPAPAAPSFVTTPEAKTSEPVTESAPPAPEVSTQDAAPPEPEPVFAHATKAEPSVIDEPVKDEAVTDATETAAPAKDAPATDAPVKDATATDAPAKEATDREATDRDAPVKDEAVTDAPAKEATDRDATVKEATDRDAAVKDATVKDDPPSAPFPSFITAPLSTDEPQEQTVSPAQDAAPAPVTPKPRIVQVPDEPDPQSYNVAPSALGLAGRVKHLTPAQRDTLRPLLAQLAALRDQMTGAHRDPR